MATDKPAQTNNSFSMLGKIAPLLVFALAFVILAILFHNSGRSNSTAQLTIEQRYMQAKGQVNRLRGDTSKAARREQWERLAQEFHAIYASGQQWSNRPAALFRAAECLEDMALRTCSRDDAQQAAQTYEQLASAHPGSQLVDDALYRAAHIRAASLGDDTGALALIAQLKKICPKGDMLPQALTLEKAILASRQGRTAPEAKAASRAREEANVARDTVAAAQEDSSQQTQPAKATASRDTAETTKLPVSTASLEATVPPANQDMTVAAQSGKKPAPASSAKTGTPQNSSNSARPALQVLSWESPTRNSVEIVLEMSAPARFSSRLVKGKGKSASIVLGLEQVEILEDLRRGARINGSLLTGIRAQQGNDGQALLHFDFRDVRRFDTRRESDPHRIILSVAAGNTPLPRKAGASSGYAANDADAATKDPGVDVAQTEDDAAPESRAPQKTPRTTRASVTSDMASQLGLSVQRVFVDAGHGGRDPGTSHNNVLEREVTQEVAQMVGRLLRANGLEVVFSRERNEGLSLSERTRLANEARADLFVSIHVNANEDKRVQGIETYFLDIARNKHAARVAALENAGSDRRLGDMQDMLAEVMLSARVGESRNLAHDVQRATLYRLKKRDYTPRDSGVKSAPFHVLIGAQMPAVLVELGYCTNSDEAVRLKDDAYRMALAEGLAEGILAYKKRLESLQTAAR